MVGIAQLVSAPDCGSGGQGFESLYPPFKKMKSFSLKRLFIFAIGLSPSGKAQDFDSCIPVVRIHLAQLLIVVLSRDIVYPSNWACPECV